MSAVSSNEPSSKAPGHIEEDLGKETKVRERILHLLQVYPVISPTMLQNALGPQTRAQVWRPILDKLIEDGLVTLTYDTVSTPLARYNAYKKLQLTEAGRSHLAAMVVAATAVKH